MSKTPKYLYVIEICQLLLDAKADITLETNKGESVLHAAAIGNNVDVVEMLINAGMYKIDVVEMLINAGMYTIDVVEMLINAGMYKMMLLKC